MHWKPKKFFRLVLTYICTYICKSEFFPCSRSLDKLRIDSENKMSDNVKCEVTIEIFEVWSNHRYLWLPARADEAVQLKTVKVRLNETWSSVARHKLKGFNFLSCNTNLISQHKSCVLWEQTLSLTMDDVRTSTSRCRKPSWTGDIKNVKKLSMASFWHYTYLLTPPKGLGAHRRC
jgi:hypothetical protein